MTKKVLITGMTCGHCSARVKEILETIEGVSKVEVNLEDKNAVLELTSEVSDGVIVNKINEVGYEVIEIV
jgi:Cu+-exporting ATPase